MKFVEFKATRAGNMFILLALKLMILLLLMDSLRVLSYALSYFVCISTTSVEFHIFANATNAFYAKRSPSEMEVIDNNLKPNFNYLMANKLSLNLEKTNFIIFQPIPSPSTLLHPPPPPPKPNFEIAKQIIHNKEICH